MGLFFLRLIKVLGSNLFLFCVLVQNISRESSVSRTSKKDAVPVKTVKLGPLSTKPRKPGPLSSKTATTTTSHR